MLNGFARVVMIDLKRNKKAYSNHIIYDLGILVVKDFNGEEEEKPHIEISYQFEQRNREQTIGDAIALEEERVIANILKDFLQNSIVTVYAMYDSHEIIPFIDEFLMEYGYMGMLSDITILDMKTISRDRTPPSNNLKELAVHYGLDPLLSQDKSALKNASLLLEILFKMQEENAKLAFYTNILGFTDKENHPGFLPCLGVQTLPQKTSSSLKIYEGFKWDNYRYENISRIEKIPIYIIEREGKFGIAIFNNDINSLYEILIPCEYDNIFTMTQPHQEDLPDNKHFTFIYSSYLILVRSGKQALCRIRYNTMRPNNREAFKLYYITESKYDYITAYGHTGYLLHKGNKKEYFSIRHNSITKPFTHYEFADYGYLIVKWDDGSYVIDTGKNTTIKISDTKDRDLFYLGGKFFSRSCEGQDIFVLKNKGVKVLEGYQYKHSIRVAKENYLGTLDTYLVVSGPDGLGVLNEEGKFIINPKYKEITAELLFSYL